MSKLLFAITIFLLNITSSVFASDEDNKRIFERNFVVSNPSSGSVTISRLRDDDALKIKLGEEFYSPADKHLRITYKVIKVTESEVVITYSSVFDARSFRDGLKKENGEFKVKIVE